MKSLKADPPPCVCHTWLMTKWRTYWDKLGVFAHTAWPLKGKFINWLAIGLEKTRIKEWKGEEKRSFTWSNLLLKHKHCGLLEQTPELHVALHPEETKRAWEFLRGLDSFAGVCLWKVKTLGIRTTGEGYVWVRLSGISDAFHKDRISLKFKSVETSCVLSLPPWLILGTPLPSEWGNIRNKSPLW